MSQCFAKHQRLLIKSEFDAVFNTNKKFHTPEFLLFVRKNELKHARIGFAFSKKQVAKASDRNRIKRLFRESFRTHSLPAVDIVAIVRKSIATVDNKTLTLRLEQTWQRIEKYYAK